MAGTVVADKWQNGDGTENFKCRAWVNFNGTGTVAIRASGNVSSITDNGVGKYTVNFITTMPDVNYSFGGSATRFGNATGWVGGSLNGTGADIALSYCKVTTSYQNSLTADFDVVTLSIHR